MTVSTFLQSNYTSQYGSTYKGAIDGNFAVTIRQAIMFAPSAQASPNMTVLLAAGHVFNGVTLTEKTAQNTGTITAPSVNPRIDRVVVDQITGVVSVITGAEAGSPTPPAITAGKCPIAQIALATSTTSITNSLITDERDFTGLGQSSQPPYGVSTNSTNAYSVTTSPSFAALTTGMHVFVKINATNTGTSTLNPNTIGATAIVDELGNILNPGDIITNTIYEFIYDGSNFVLMNRSGASTPSGSSIDFRGATIPATHLLTYGQAISRTVYSRLFAALGTLYGVGNGTTTFNLPDDRGVVLAGADNMGGSGAGILTSHTGGVDGTTLGATGGEQSHALSSGELAAHTHDGSGFSTSSDGSHTHGMSASTWNAGSTTNAGAQANTILNLTLSGAFMGAAGSHTHSISGNTGSTGSGTGHNNVQPTSISNKIIKI